MTRATSASLVAGPSRMGPDAAIRGPVMIPAEIFCRMLPSRSKSSSRLPGPHARDTVGHEQRQEGIYRSLRSGRACMSHRPGIKNFPLPSTTVVR